MNLLPKHISVLGWQNDLNGHGFWESPSIEVGTAKPITMLQDRRDQCQLFADKESLIR